MSVMRLVAVLLVVNVVCALLSAQPSSLLATQVSHAEGCHGDRPAIPPPSSTRYDCCVNGHHAAIPSATFSLQSATAELSLSRSEVPDGNFVPYFRSTLLVLVSSSPPSAIPLRI
jgi:hypothetical protein